VSSRSLELCLDDLGCYTEMYRGAISVCAKRTVLYTVLYVILDVIHISKSP